MRLAFSGQAHYPDFDEGYELYVKRSRTRQCVDRKTYNRIVRAYCGRMRDKLLKTGLVDFPNEIGSVAAAVFTRKPKYKDGKFLGFGKMDYKKGHYDGSYHAFGLVFLPRRSKGQNLRCYGFVGNKRLFRKMKEIYTSDDCPWVPLGFSEEMV